MKKEISYFVDSNGLYFSFDSIESYFHDGRRIVSFHRKIVGSEFGCHLCSIDLSRCTLRFTFKSKSTGTYYFEIVPVGGVCNG